MTEESSPCGCIFCKNDNPFDVPEGLVDDFMAGRVAIFAGAGVSTEASTVLSFTLYEKIMSELGESAEGLSFPELMSKYCKQRDGRLKLISNIRERFDYIKSYPELLSRATRFHRELATLYAVDTIITTNWDTLFEEECLAVPFVSDEDMVLWSAARRRVLKLHGSVQNLGSVIATSEDYDRSRQALANGLLGARFKTILSDKTIVYVGYSYRDHDLAYINDFVADRLGALHKQGYIITLDKSQEARARYARANLVPIFTDAAYFMKQIKAHAQQSYCMLPDTVYDLCGGLLIKVQDQHRWLTDTFNPVDHPDYINCAFYQDGLIHCMERALTLRGSGQYSDIHRLMGVIDTYGQLRREKLKARRYDDVSYIDGYVAGILFIAYGSKEHTAPPLFYLYGFDDIWSRAELEESLPKAATTHKLAARRSRKLLQEMGVTRDMVVQHVPELR